MQAQTAAAMAQADVVLFLVDARAGTTDTDRGFADLVRKSGKPAIVVANKGEGRAGEAGALEAYALGLGEPVAISAEHGEGLAACTRRCARRSRKQRPRARPTRSRRPLPKKSRSASRWSAGPTPANPR